MRISPSFLGTNLDDCGPLLLRDVVSECALEHVNRLPGNMTDEPVLLGKVATNEFRRLILRTFNLDGHRRLALLDDFSCLMVEFDGCDLAKRNHAALQTSRVVNPAP